MLDSCRNGVNEQQNLERFYYARDFDYADNKAFDETSFYLTQKIRNTPAKINAKAQSMKKDSKGIGTSKDIVEKESE